MPTVSRRLRSAPVIAFLVFTVLGVARFGYVYLNDLARAKADSPWPKLIEELSGGWAACVVFLILLKVVPRYRPWRRTWSRSVPVYALVVLGLGVLHTSLMWAARLVAFPFFGLGSYDYGIMRFRYPMEFFSQAPVFILMIIGIHTVLHRKELAEQETRAARLEAELGKARLKALEAQLQPHFLFNTLNAVSGIMYRDPGRADRLLARLSELLRLSFDGAKAGEISLGDELHWLAIYLELMRARFEDRLTVEVAVPEAVRSLAVPRLLLQPLVENAIRYGAASRAGPATVGIVGRVDGETLELEVWDNGPGLKPGAGNGTGVGLSNTRARLAQLYGEHGKLSLSERPEGGVRAVIRLPAHPAPLGSPA